MSPRDCEDGGSGWTKMEEKREASSTALRSCRAGRNTAARPPRTAWCQSCRSSACRPRWGRSEHLRSNSSTSHRDSETKAEVRTGWKKTVVRIKMERRAYHPACPCCQLQDAFSWTFPVTAGEIQRLLQESLGTDVIEQKRAKAGAHRHYVLIEAHWTDPWTHKHFLVSGKQVKTESEFTETHQIYYLRVNSYEHLSSMPTMEINVWFSQGYLISVTWMKDEQKCDLSPSTAWNSNGTFLLSFCNIIWGLLPTDKSKIVIYLVILFCHRPLTTSSLSRADRLDGVRRLPGIQEGNMGLRAYSIHRPVLPIGQAHILFAVRQLSGQKLAGQKTP